MKYSNYKDSGEKWLGRVPEHWQILKLKYLLKDISIKNKPSLELLSVTQDQGVIPRRIVENRMVMPSGNLESFKVIKEGDFAISLRSFEGGLEYSSYTGIISPAYTVLNALKIIHNPYYKYLFKSDSFIGELQLSVVGIREGKNISYELLKHSRIQIPPLPEQIAIADFLDEKTKKIDETIALKETQITLLKKRRQIIIQELVTGKKVWDGEKWTKPNKTKDSGVDWIGEIPEHWDVRKLKFIANVVLGKMICNEDKGGYYLKPYLKSKNIQWMELNLSSVDEMWFSHKELIKYKLNYNDIVVSEGGEVGKSCIWKNELPECYIQNSAHKVTVSNNCNPLFILNLFYTYGKLNVFDAIVSKVSIGHLTREKLINMYVTIPNLKNQNQICDYLQKLQTLTLKTIEIKQQEIQKLKEYRTILIDNVVTGKIKVYKE